MDFHQMKNKYYPWKNIFANPMILETGKLDF